MMIINDDYDISKNCKDNENDNKVISLPNFSFFQSKAIFCCNQSLMGLIIWTMIKPLTLTRE